MRAIALLLFLASRVAFADEASSLDAFARLPADPVPPEIVRDTHYWISNEDRLDLFYDEVKDKGGVYVGVGSDQNYLLAAWARSDVLVLLDFDQAIVDLHRVYRVIFRAAETPTDFLRLWQWESRQEVRRLIEEGYPVATERVGALRAFSTARWSVERRLRRLVEQMAKVSRPCFLVDTDQYDHIRRLYLADKIFLVRGDLTARRTLHALGQAVVAAGLEVKVLYLSNAEQYFPYDAQYRRNIRELPMDEGTVVLRTSGQRGLPHVKGTYYHYNAQVGTSFAAWLEDKGARSVFGMLKLAPPQGEYGFSRLDIGPEEARAAARQRGVEQRGQKGVGAPQAGHQEPVQ